MTKNSVLYISDSLGTPVHPRGIFNYSIAMVEMLKFLGHSVSIVAERSPGFGMTAFDIGTTDSRLNNFHRHADLADTYRYFANHIFSFSWELDARYVQAAIEEFRASPSAGSQDGDVPVYDSASTMLTPSIRQRIADFYDAEANPSPVSTKLLGKIEEYGPAPDRGSHLKLFDEIVLISRFYSGSMSRAVNFIPPYVIDCSGYDSVMIDSPHYFRLANIDNCRVFVVIHDLIPVCDPSMSQDWRRLWLQKLNASLALKPNLIFVSEQTRDDFHRFLPDYVAGAETVLYPTIRRELAGSIEKVVSNSLVSSIASQRGFQRDKFIARQVRAKGQPPLLTPLLRRRLGLVTEAWDASLPVFTTVVSDEPRKNVSLLIEASEQLRGVANIVIIGQINAEKYVGDNEMSYPNVAFAGYVTDQEKKATILESAGLIFPSFSEGFGIPVMEGALLGSPVLCSTIPVFKEILGENALFFSPNRADELISCVRETLADPQAARKRALAAQTFVTDKFSQEVMRRRLGTFLEIAFSGSHEPV